MRVWGMKGIKTMRFGALVLGLAALVAAPDLASARDGCGRGYYFNGRGCVPMQQGYYGGGYGGGGYGYGRRYVDPGSPYAPNFRGNVVRPTVGRDGAISCSNPRYTWQNGACRPY
jgi:hypothetical protein